MLPAHIEKWVKALRSGEYTQQKGTLKGPNGYCCLGVFCSIMGNEPPKQWYMNDEGPTKLYDFCRININDFVYYTGISMNDDGCTFAEIANMIEREYGV